MVRRGSWAAAAWLALAHAPGLLGCGRILGVDGYRVAPAPSGTKPAEGARDASRAGDAAPGYPSNTFSFSFSTSLCQRCSDESCATEERACAGDADCNAWARCRAACTDAKCVAECPERVPRVASAPSAEAYGVCLNRHCSVPCSSRRAGVDSALGTVAYDCVTDRCSDALAASPDGGTSLLDACLSASGPCAAARGQADWSCVGHVEWPQPLAVSVPADFTVVAVDFVKLGPISGGAVSACPRASDGCASPLATGTTDGTGGTGLHFTSLEIFPDGLFDYWEFRHPSYLPVMNWMTPPPVGATLDVRAEMPLTYLANQRAQGATLDVTELGLVGVLQQDCASTNAPGVTLEVDEGNAHAPTDLPMIIQYTSGLQVIVGATSTDHTGLADALNVKPGAITVRTRLAATGEIISEQHAEARAGWGTFFTLPPTPLGVH